MSDRSVLVRLRADISQFQRQMATASRTTSAFVKDLDSADSRMSNIVQTALALGPALVPIGAAGVTAIAGLATQLGFAAAGAGATVLAFHGVGDALDALNKYQLEPTDANLKKVEQTLGKLGPAAGDFVMFLDDVEPKLRRLQRTAANGVLPGVTEGLDEFLKRTPQVRRIISEIATASGDLIGDAGSALSSDRWDPFFNYLENEAAPTLTAFGKTVGNIFEGLANTMMAFDPLSDQFSSGMLNWSRDFAEATANLDDNEGFQSFLEYVERVGPKAVDTLGALGGALGAVVNAAAPVGEATLPALTALAHVVETVAESPAGPVLIATAAGVSAVSRAVALFNATNGSAFASFMGFGGKSAGGSGLAMLNQRVNAIKAGAGAAGLLAVSLTDLDDKMGIANTATLALAGSFLGPWGAAIGGGIGLVKDMSALNDDLEGSMQRVNVAAKSGDLQSWNAALEGQRNALQNYTEDMNAFETTLLGAKTILTLGGPLRDAGKNSQAYLDNAAALQKYQTALEMITASVSPDKYERWKTFGFTMADLQSTFERAAPAAAKFGIDLDAALKAGADSPEWHALIDAIRRYNTEVDTAPGRSKAVGEALAGMRDEMNSTTDAASTLDDALQALFGPGLNQSAAADAWTESLIGLRKQIKDNSGALEGNSRAALDNREAIRSSVSSLSEKIAADAAAGESGDKLAASLLAGRKAIIDQATAAGANRGKVVDYLNALGLVPENLATIILTPGLLTAKQQVAALSKLYNLTPKEVRTLLKADPTGALLGIGKVKGALASLRSKTIYIDTVARSHNAVADGGTIMGQRQPYGDKVHAFLAPGEEVISNRHGQADRNRGLLKAINANRLAGGGTVGGYGPSNIPGGVVLEGPLSELAKAATAAAKGLGDHKKALEADRDSLQELRDARQNLVQGAAGSFDRSPFGEGLTEAFGTLQATRNDARKMRRALKKAKHLGLSGSAFEALAQSGDLQTAQELDTKAEVRKFEKLYNQQQRAFGSLGQFAGDTVYKGQIQDLRAAVHDLRATVKNLRHDVKEGAREGTRDGARMGMDANNRAGYGQRGA